MSRFSQMPGLAWLSFYKDRSTSRIFISYRREEARGDAGRLTDDLKEHFGEEQIFRDIDAIEPGVDFVEAINRAVSACAVLLAIIGPNWLTVQDKGGRRRLDAPHDFIRLEIGAALNRNIRVIPVLVGGATMPREDELPPDLAPLSRRQAYDLSDKRWEFDVGQLIETLAKIPRIIRKPGWKKEPSRGWARRKITWAVAVVLVVGVVLPMGAAVIYSEYKAVIDTAIDQAFVGQGLSATVPPNVQPGLSFPQPAPKPVQRRMSHTGLDAIGQYPTVVQVFNPG
jgi:hypothetical protein